MCDGEEGCFLIRAYKTTRATHGHDAAVIEAASLYRETNTETSLAEAIAFINRFVIPGEKPPVCPMRT